MCDVVLNMPLLKNKAGAKCVKRTLDVKCKLHYVFWNISMILANVWLRNVRFENLLISFVKQHFRPSLLKFDWLFLFGFFLVGYMLPLIFRFKNDTYVTLEANFQNLAKHPRWRFLQNELLAFRFWLFLQKAPS